MLFFWGDDYVVCILDNKKTKPKQAAKTQILFWPSVPIWIAPLDFLFFFLMLLIVSLLIIFIGLF